MFTLIAKMLKVLNSEASPWQVSWGIAFGLMAGLLPFGLLTILVLLLVCFFTINLSTFIVVWGLSGGLMMLFGHHLETFTWQVAQHPAMLNVLASSEFLQVLHLHHTLVLGAFSLGLLLLVPVAYLSAFLVKKYRQHLMSKIEKWKITQALKATKIFKLYETLN